jgi:hypothetical protein
MSVSLSLQTCFNSLSLRERVGERGKENKFLIISPHPGLPPEGEGILFCFGE